MFALRPCFRVFQSAARSSPPEAVVAVTQDTPKMITAKVEDTKTTRTMTDAEVEAASYVGRMSGREIKELQFRERYDESLLINLRDNLRLR